jgi:hypothetical protein
MRKWKDDSNSTLRRSNGPELCYFRGIIKIASIREEVSDIKYHH